MYSRIVTRSCRSPRRATLLPSTTLFRSIATEEQLDGAAPQEDLLTMEGMDRELAVALAMKGITTMEDLAEQSIDDLLDIDGMDEDRAGKLIMAARAPWFEDQQ